MNNFDLKIGVDIGGSHISAALVRASNGTLLPETYRRKQIDPSAGASAILDGWMEVINEVLSLEDSSRVKGIGLAMPGPFDYENGISMIRGVNKYESLYGLNIREAFFDRLVFKDLPVHFENDAACFGLGESRKGQAAPYAKVIAITLGTGLGACFIDHKNLVKKGEGIPPRGYLYNIPFLQGIAEDYISARWLLKEYKIRTGLVLKDVRELALRALSEKEATALAIFHLFGTNLGLFLADWIKSYGADCLSIGGSIAQSQTLFLPAVQTVFAEQQITVAITLSEHTEQIALSGAAGLTDGQSNPTAPEKGQPVITARKSLQPLLPKQIACVPPATDPTGASAPSSGEYDIYPFESLGSGFIFSGYSSLAKWIIRQKTVRIDGYAGINWNLVRAGLLPELRRAGVKTSWYESCAFEREEEEITSLVRPFLGSDGTVWGTKTSLRLADFYTKDLIDWQPDPGTADVIILAGTGAALTHWKTPVIYIDLPKNELQYRMRAGSATNLGSTVIDSMPEMYKRSYFIDWVVLNNHRRDIGPSIAVITDGQREEDPNWTLAGSIRDGLRSIAHNGIRARPWFEPGVWGGQWLKQQISALSREEINYAWSFELIAPENGLIFESDGYLLEIAFDWLMEYEQTAVLGLDAPRFGSEFPIRFDFLDTFDGGNLSIQCHPSLPYIREHFGETITQDETYYILDCKAGAGVYLGFQENIDPLGFRQVLEDSQSNNEAIDIEQYVQRLPVQKHDLFLIPNRTIHGAGTDNLVLEISATPYIFTFKMYDWMRLDLEGLPRPINIEHAFNNLSFERKGEKVRQELISAPQLLETDDNGQLELLPTHPEHFYGIHRITINRQSAQSIHMKGKCHLLMLVEGDSITIRTPQGRKYLIRYAETFVLPAAAEKYELINHHYKPVKLIKAFVK